MVRSRTGKNNRGWFIPHSKIKSSFCNLTIQWRCSLTLSLCLITQVCCFKIFLVKLFYFIVHHKGTICSHFNGHSAAWSLIVSCARLNESDPAACFLHTDEIQLASFNGQCSSALDAVARLETRSILTAHPSLWLNGDAQRGELKSEQKLAEKIQSWLITSGESKRQRGVKRSEYNTFLLSDINSNSAVTLWLCWKWCTLLSAAAQHKLCNIRSVHYCRPEPPDALGLRFSARILVISDPLLKEFLK